MSTKIRNIILVQLTLDELRQVIGLLQPSYKELKVLNTMEPYGAEWVEKLGALKIFTHKPETKVLRITSTGVETAQLNGSSDEN